MGPEEICQISINNHREISRLRTCHDLANIGNADLMKNHSQKLPINAIKDFM